MPENCRFDRRGFLRLTGAGTFVALGGFASPGCARLSDPGVPALPGGSEKTTAADPTIWRVSADPLVAATASGPLDGLRVAVTDLYAVAGQQIGAGNRQWLAAAPVEHDTADAVAALLDHGARLTGLAHTDDLGFGHTGTNSRAGTPPNPAAPGRLPGGSSSGAASAVSTGAADVALGVDTTGSMRIPVSYQGLYGFVPSRGAVSTTGLLSLSSTFDVPGWACRDIDTLDRVSRVLLPAGNGRPIDRAIASDGLGAIADAQVFAAVTAVLDEHTPRVDRADPDIGSVPDWYDALRTVLGYEAIRAHGAFLASTSTSLGHESRENVAEASRVGESAYARHLREISEAARAIGQFMAGRVLMIPTTSSSAPNPGSDLTGTLRNTGMLTCLASIAGLPSVTVPLKTSEGLPAGLSLIGPHGRDADLLATALRFESERRE